MASKVKVSKEEKPSNTSKTSNSGFFPKIFRFITETWKLILVSFISAIILIATIIQSIKLYYNIQEQQKILAERGKTEKELAFWTGELSKYKNYRDIYFKIATLEYQLGDKEDAKVNLNKALEIDPNFEKGREMEKLIGQ